MIKPFTTPNPTEHKFIMLINVKMLTIVVILTLIIVTNTSPGSLKAREVFIIQHYNQIKPVLRAHTSLKTDSYFLEGSDMTVEIISRSISMKV